MNNSDEIVIGIDYGETNIGLAFGRNGLISPIKVVSGKNSMTAAHEICRYGMDMKAAKYVMGLPLGFDHQETPQSIKVRKFSKLLKSMSKKPVEFVDEYDSTNLGIVEAIETGVPQKARRVIDQYSATIILRTYYGI